MRRGDVSIRMLYAEHAVQLECVRHQAARFIPLDAGAFGRELVSFFQEHEECSAGAPGVIVDVSITSPRVSAD